jgi:hypothetical protein
MKNQNIGVYKMNINRMITRQTVKILCKNLEKMVEKRRENNTKTYIKPLKSLKMIDISEPINSGIMQISNYVRKHYL